MAARCHVTSSPSSKRLPKYPPLPTHFLGQRPLNFRLSILPYIQRLIHLMFSRKNGCHMVHTVLLRVTEPRGFTTFNVLPTAAISLCDPAPHSINSPSPARTSEYLYCFAVYKRRGGLEFDLFRFGYSCISIYFFAHFDDNCHC